MMSRIVVIGAAWTAAWWVVIGSIAAPALPGRWTTIALAWAVSVLPLIVLTRRSAGAYPSALVRLFVFRPFWYFQLAAPVIAGSGVLGALIGWPFGGPGAFGRTAQAVATAGLALGAGIGYIGSRRLRTRRLNVQLPQLPPGLEGLRIVQISDLHVGPHTSRRHLARVARAVREAQPDLIAVTGDQVDDYGGDVRDFSAAFAGLSAPLGVFAIPGNHDVYAGWPLVRDGLEAMGLSVLVNRAVPIARNGSELWLVGTGDPAATGTPILGVGGCAPDIEQSLAGVPAGAFTVALAHNPALWPALAARGVALTLSGHTHYGQFSIPRMNWSLASLFLEHAMDWYRRGTSLLYINPGTNYWGVPLRIGALPEVTVLTLRRDDDAAICATRVEAEPTVACAQRTSMGMARVRVLPWSRDEWTSVWSTYRPGGTVARARSGAKV